MDHIWDVKQPQSLPVDWFTSGHVTVLRTYGEGPDPNSGNCTKEVFLSLYLFWTEDGFCTTNYRIPYRLFTLPSLLLGTCYGTLSRRDW